MVDPDKTYNLTKEIAEILRDSTEYPGLYFKSKFDSDEGIWRFTVCEESFIRIQFGSVWIREIEWLEPMGKYVLVGYRKVENSSEVLEGLMLLSRYFIGI